MPRKTACSAMMEQLCEYEPDAAGVRKQSPVSSLQNSRDENRVQAQIEDHLRERVISTTSLQIISWSCAFDFHHLMSASDLALPFSQRAVSWPEPRRHPGCPCSGEPAVVADTIFISSFAALFRGPRGVLNHSRSPPASVSRRSQDG